MNIRRIELSDVINVLTCNVCNIPENYYVRYWTSMISEWPELSFLVEDERGKVVGYVLSSIEPEEGDPYTQMGHINSLSVLRPYRRLGLAQKLMNMTKDAIMREDDTIENIQLHVRKSNRAALSLYRKLGYRDHRADPKYYADDEDALIMRLRIRSRDPTQQERPSPDTQIRTRKTWIANLWYFVHHKPQQFAGATLALLRRRNSHP